MWPLEILYFLSVPHWLVLPFLVTNKHVQATPWDKTFLTKHQYVTSWD